MIALAGPSLTAEKGKSRKKSMHGRMAATFSRSPSFQSPAICCEQMPGSISLLKGATLRNGNNLEEFRISAAAAAADDDDDDDDDEQRWPAITFLFDTEITKRTAKASRKIRHR